MNIVALPVRALRRADRSVRRAITNAGDAVTVLAAGNAQRRALAPSTTSDGAVHGDLVRLSREESLRLLRTRCVGHFAHVESARALSIVPVNYVLTADDVVLFRSGPGPKLASADRGDVVAFQVDDIDNDLHVGWSVLVVGHARRLSWSEADRLVDRPTPWASGPRTQVVEITPTRIDGRQLF